MQSKCDDGHSQSTSESICKNCMIFSFFCFETAKKLLLLKKLYKTGLHLGVLFKLTFP